MQDPLPDAAPGAVNVKRHLPLHPLLFAALPILFLYSHNISELYLAQLALPLLLSAGAALLLLLLLRLALRDWLRAALVSSLFWVWFFWFGRLHDLVEPTPQAGLGSGRTALFVILYITALLVGAGLIAAQRRELRAVSSLANLIALVLVAWQVIAIGGYELKRAIALRRVQRAPAIAATAPRARVRPNIYYIILDGYARADVLRDLYHCDNSDFLRFLEQRGFQIARDGRANYCQTILSVAATLNLDYLDDIAARVGLDCTDRAPLSRMIQDNRLCRFLRQRGYRIVGFSSEYAPIELRSADIHIGGPSGLSEFQAAILDTTPLPVLLGLGQRPALEPPHPQRVLYAFDHLTEATRLEPLIFVFAHIMCPHAPVVFDRNGRVISTDYRFIRDDTVALQRAWIQGPAGYVEQLRFVNRKTKQLVDALLSKSRWPTVIVIMSDHGPGTRTNWTSVEKTDVRERLGAFVACYLPGADDLRLPDDLSGVNVFRIVLNRYFGADLPLLPNESYYSTARHPYRFIRVTERVAAPAAGKGRSGPN